MVTAIESKEGNNLCCPICSKPLVHVGGVHDLACVGYAKGECGFGLSYTDSGPDGILLDLRIIHDKTNYGYLADLLKHIAGRVSRRYGTAGLEILAPMQNSSGHYKTGRIPDMARVLRSFPWLKEEDIWSINLSTEPADQIAKYYRIKTRDVRQIRRMKLARRKKVA